MLCFQTIVVDCLPTWLLGCYGRSFSGKSATPTIDAISQTGTAFDNLFVAAAEPPCADAITVETRIHFPTSAAAAVREAAPNLVVVERSPGESTTAFNEISGGVWREFLEIADEFGFDVSEKKSLPCDVLAAMSESELAEIFCEEEMLLSDALAEIANRALGQAVAKLDAQIAALVAGQSDKTTVLLGLSTFTPPGTLNAPAFDVSRHVPMIVSGPGVGQSRVGGLLSVEQVLELLSTLDAVDGRNVDGRNVEHRNVVQRISDLATDVLLFDCTNGDRGIRTDTGLLLCETRDGEPRERFFVKADDRWNQLDLAAQRPVDVEVHRRLGDAC